MNFLLRLEELYSAELNVPAKLIVSFLYWKN